MFRADLGRKHLNDKERASIIAFTDCGKAVSFISERLGISCSNVSLWQTRYRETGEIIRQRGSGRPKNLCLRMKKISFLRSLQKLSQQRKKSQANLMLKTNCHKMSSMLLCHQTQSSVFLKKEIFVPGVLRVNYF